MSLRLLCDEMLFRLARSLRAAGYDTVLAADGAPDRDLIARCRREHRVLITRDRKLMAAALPDVQAVLLVDEDREAEARALGRALDIDWLLAPLTRCMVDNTPLSDPGPADFARVPSTIEAPPGSVKVCRTCGRVYWPGSHVKRLIEKLSCWNEGAGRRAVSRPSDAARRGSRPAGPRSGSAPGRPSRPADRGG